MIGPNILVIAGEASGDIHASNIIRDLKQLSPDLHVWGTGGDALSGAGVEILYNVSSLHVIGFIEVLRKYRFFKSVFNTILDECRQRKPQLAILVDYPGFNLRLAKQLKALGIPVVYYIAPQVWAWKENRIKILQKCVDELIVVFPFEVGYFQRHGIRASFFGHPLIDQLQKPLDDHERDRTLIAYLPGSRPVEIEHHLPIVCEVMKKLGSEFTHVIGKPPSLSPSIYKKFQQVYPFRLVENSRELVRNSHVALVKSGTSTMETAMLRTPMAVFYKTSMLSYQIAKRAVQITSIAMPNILSGKQFIQEFIQHGASSEAIAKELLRLINDNDYRSTMIHEFDVIRETLGSPGSSQRVAEFIQKRFNI